MHRFERRGGDEGLAPDSQVILGHVSMIMDMAETNGTIVTVRRLTVLLGPMPLHTPH